MVIEYLDSSDAYDTSCSNINDLSLNMLLSENIFGSRNGKSVSGLINSTNGQWPV